VYTAIPITLKITFTVLGVQVVEGEFDFPPSLTLQPANRWNSAKGTAITFFTTNDSKQARDLLTVLREAKQQIPPELAEMGRGGFGGGGNSRYGGRGGRGGRGGGGGGGGGDLLPLNMFSSPLLISGCL
jgi:hypothetical protein